MNLTFTRYIGSVISNGSYRLSQLCRMRKFISKQTAIMLYKSMILSIIDYGSIFYGSANSNHLKRLQSIQNKAISIIALLPKRTNTDYYHDELGIQFLEERRFRQLMLLAFKFCQNDTNLLVKNTVEQCITRLNDPNRKQLSIFTPTKAQCEKSFSFRLRRDWNKLPTFLHACSSRKELTNLLAVYSSGGSVDMNFGCKWNYYSYIWLISMCPNLIQISQLYCIVL